MNRFLSQRAQLFNLVNRIKIIGGDPLQILQKAEREIENGNGLRSCLNCKVQNGCEIKAGAISIATKMEKQSRTHSQHNIGVDLFEICSHNCSKYVKIKSKLMN